MTDAPAPPEGAPAPANDAPAPPKDADAHSYVDIEAQVDAHFGGNWESFFKAVQNPADIMGFVLHRHCEGNAEKFEAWAKEKKFPPDWIGRFFSTLTEKGAPK